MKNRINNIKRKVVSIVMVATIIVSLFSQIAWSAVAKVAFSDTIGHWAEASVVLAAEKGYVNGYEDGTFRPDQSVSRAEFVKMVHVALGLPFSGSTEGNDWYVPYINAAVGAGIHQWSDFNTGTWNTSITRQEMARIAVRAAGIEVEDDSIAAYMYEATKNGLIRGLEGSMLAPEETTTRAQSVTVIDRILLLKEGGELDVDEDAWSYAAYEYKHTNAEVLLERHNQRPTPLPMELYTGDTYVTAKITKMVMVDYDRQDGAFRDWFPYVRYAGEEIGEGNYVIGFYIEMTNEETDRAGGFNAYSSYRSVGLATTGMVPEDYYDRTPVRMVKHMPFPKAKEMEGWMISVYPKDYLDRVGSEVRLSNSMNKWIFFSEYIK